MNIQYASAVLGAHKRFRQGQILKLVGSEAIASQDDLRRRLAQMRVRVTQATLSRDLRELQLVKTAEGYKPLGAAPAEKASVPTLAQTLREFLLDVRPAQNLLVLKTPPGGAQPLAVALDRERWNEIAGTVAGDDTILLILPNNRTRLAVQKRIEDLLR
jgi:transcriptional regulator of arginine metabolism